MHVLIYTKSKKKAKHFNIQTVRHFTKSKTTVVTIFIYKNQVTLRYATFHENFEVGIYIQKSQHFALHEVFIYKNPDTSQKSRQFALCFNFFIQKAGHFALRNFSWNF